MTLAVLSPYRYRLERRLHHAAPTLAAIMVNPSTADDANDDATIRKLVGFALRNSYGRVLVGNLFAWRATDIRDLARSADPVGPDNDEHIRRILAAADDVLVAWGPAVKVPRAWRDRWRAMAGLIAEAGHIPICLGTAKDGHPRHPLMVPYAQEMIPWNAP